jgi:methylenetetrahydrofolate dehydrogenase (NADP+)/methenyltetrahydrofolate cyclohydrolase
MAFGYDDFIPATQYFRVVRTFTNVETKGKHTVVIGRSHIVTTNEYSNGKQCSPGNSTATHSYTKISLKSQHKPILSLL